MIVDTAPAILRTEHGHALGVDAARWFASADDCDRRALWGARGPVLDIGCGPGRHVVALAEIGIPALGIDITTTALRHARAAGAAVLERCVFDEVPAAGRWPTALLFDGNVGIGGDPVALLRRVTELLAERGRLLVELDHPGASRYDGRVRFEVPTGTPKIGPWFAWTTVSADDVDDLADAAGLAVERRWCDDERWFAWLRA